MWSPFLEKDDHKRLSEMLDEFYKNFMELVKRFVDAAEHSRETEQYSHVIYDLNHRLNFEELKKKLTSKLN